jgi:hypothetical protein
MICYKGRTFCINNKCENRCDRYLTQEIIKESENTGLGLSVSEQCCKGEEIAKKE